VSDGRAPQPLNERLAGMQKGAHGRIAHVAAMLEHRVEKGLDFFSIGLEGHG
jgi:hypothetical protein